MTNPSEKRIEIRAAVESDIPALYVLYKSIGQKEPGYFEEVFQKKIVVFIAQISGQDCAFCLFNQNPKYSLYQKLGIPEIQDLNVVPEHRQKGIATALVKHCEQIALQQKHEKIGISVGLTKDYGPAQRLYAKLGYIPDGYGVTYDREFVTPMSVQCIDDNLCLMLVKTLV